MRISTEKRPVTSHHSYLPASSRLVGSLRPNRFQVDIPGSNQLINCQMLIQMRKNYFALPYNLC
jgi:hypothetical protein